MSTTGKRPSKYLIILAMIPSSLWAEAPPVLEEVIVTAQKRVERLQDVPISVAVTTGEKLSEYNIVNLEELTYSTPNLFVAENPVGNYIFIRGIGSQTNQGIEQSVATFSDGIYRGRMQQSRAPFLDQARIEVLRGPQSILFGKNTVGGAINLISAQPGDELEGSISALYTDKLGEQNIEAVVSGPITDQLGIRLAFKDYRSDGYMDNLTTGKTDPKRDEQTYRVILAWDPSEDLDVNIKYEHSDFDSRGRTSQQIGTGFAFDNERTVANDGGQALLNAGEITQEYIDDTFLYLVSGEYSKNTMDEAALRFDLQLGDHTLTSITGLSSYAYHEHSDVDFSNVPLIQVDAQEDFEQYSQELRLSSPTDGRWDYITGLYWQQTYIEFEEADDFASNLVAEDLIPDNALVRSLLQPDDVPNVSRPFNFDQKSKTLAAFAQGTMHIRDDLRLTLGVRYSYETKEATQNVFYRDLGSDQTYSCADAPTVDEVVGGSGDKDLSIRCQLYTGYLTDQILEHPIYGNIPGIEESLNGLLNLGTFEHSFDTSRSEGQWTPSINVQYDINEETMLYLSAATGFKGGGFDARILVDSIEKFEFDDEQALSFELGTKMSLAEGSGELNIALFYTEIDDLQVSLFDGYTGFSVGNAAKMRSQGIEADSRWRLTENLDLSFALAWLDSEFTNFKNAGCTDAQFDAWETANPGKREECIQDMSGQPTFLSPELQANISLLHTFAIGDSLLLRSGLDINYNDEYFLDPDNDPNLVQDAYYLINARIALSDQADRWEVAVLGKNLTDEDISFHGSDIPLSNGSFYQQISPPRSVSVQGIWRF